MPARRTENPPSRRPPPGVLYRGTRTSPPGASRARSGLLYAYSKATLLRPYRQVGPGIHPAKPTIRCSIKSVDNINVCRVRAGSYRSDYQRGQQRTSSVAHSFPPTTGTSGSQFARTVV